MKSTKSQQSLAVGITGGIGSGKSEVAKIFQQLGAKILFSDEIARELVNTDQSIKRKIQEAFGKNIYLNNGLLDSKKISQIIFENQNSRKFFDSVIHPPVLKLIEEEIKKANLNSSNQLTFVEAALIYEARAEKLFDYIIVVNADTEQSIERVMKRDRATRAEVVLRINAQMPAKDKIARADFVINNNGNKLLLEKNCRFLFGLLNNLAKNQ